MREKYEKIIKAFLNQEGIKIHGHDIDDYHNSLESHIFDKFKISTIVFNKDCEYDAFSDSHRPYLSDRVYSEKEIGNPESYFREHKVFKTNQNIENYLEFARKFNNFIKERD